MKIECKRAKGMIPLDFYGELSDREKTHLLKHIEECSKCKGDYKSIMTTLMVIPRQSGISSNESVIRLLSAKIKKSIGDLGNQKYQKKGPLLSKDFVYTLTACCLLTIIMHNFILPKWNGKNSSNSVPQFISAESSKESGSKSKSILYRSIYTTRTGLLETESQESIAIINSFKRIAFEDKDFDVQISAVGVLARLGSPFAVESLIEIANQHNDPKVRRVAIACLTSCLEAKNADSARYKGML